MVTSGHGSGGERGQEGTDAQSGWKPQEASERETVLTPAQGTELEHVSADVDVVDAPK